MSLTSGVASGGEVEGRLGEVVEHPRPQAALLPQQPAQAVQLTELRSVVHDRVATVTCRMGAVNMVNPHDSLTKTSSGLYACHYPGNPLYDNRL